MALLKLSPTVFYLEQSYTNIDLNDLLFVERLNLWMLALKDQNMLSNHSKINNSFVKLALFSVKSSPSSGQLLDYTTPTLFWLARGVQPTLSNRLLHPTKK